MKSSEWDVLVIGGGPGGYVAALRAAQLGKRVTLVEKSDLGGICLNWGCIPTKTLLRSADLLRQFKNAAAFGIKAGEALPDLTAIVERSRKVAQQLNRGVEHLLRKAGVRVVKGEARLLGAGSVEVVDAGGSNQFEAAHIIVATGARPKKLQVFGSVTEGVWSYRDALAPRALPKRMLIVGAGAIGVEFASFYHAMGSSVTLIDAAERILPFADEQVSAAVESSLAKEGLTVATGTRIAAARREASAWQVQLDGRKPQSIVADVVLVAVGIEGNVEDLGLELTNARTERGHIVVDELCRTGERGLYAIGDVAGPPWLAHKASHEGIMVAELIAGLNPHPVDAMQVPSCIYSHPQAASVGLTEAQAIGAGYTVKVGQFPFSANGKAIAMGQTFGFAKVIFDERTGALLGAHLVGDEVTEMIQGFVVAQRLETTETELINSVFPHPSMSEAMHEAVLAAFGRPLHL